MRLTIRLKRALTLRPAGPAHPLFDNRATDEVASPEERSDEGSLLGSREDRHPEERRDEGFLRAANSFRNHTYEQSPPTTLL